MEGTAVVLSRVLVTLVVLAFVLGFEVEELIVEDCTVVVLAAVVPFLVVMS